MKRYANPLKAQQNCAEADQQGRNGTPNLFHHEVTGPVPVRRGADHRDRAHPFEDGADLGVGIRDRVELAHGAPRRSITGLFPLYRISAISVPLWRWEEHTSEFQSPYVISYA